MSELHMGIKNIQTKDARRVRTTRKCLALCEGLGHSRPRIFARANCATDAHSPSSFFFLAALASVSFGCVLVQVRKSLQWSDEKKRAKKQAQRRKKTAVDVFRVFSLKTYGFTYQR